MRHRYTSDDLMRMRNQIPIAYVIATALALPWKRSKSRNWPALTTAGTADWSMPCSNGPATIANCARPAVWWNSSGSSVCSETRQVVKFPRQRAKELEPFCAVKQSPETMDRVKKLVAR